MRQFNSKLIISAKHEEEYYNLQNFHSILKLPIASAFYSLRGAEVLVNNPNDSTFTISNRDRRWLLLQGLLRKQAEGG